MIRAVIVWVNFGPYLLARARALTRIEDIDAHFVELAPEERIRSWKIARDALDFPLTTLTNTAYEQTPLTELVAELTHTLKSLDPDSVAVPSYSPLPMLATARWARSNGAASIMMFDSTEVDQQRRWWKERTKRWLVERYYDAGFVAGTASRNYLTRLGMQSDRIWEGYDTVDNDYFVGKSGDVSRRAVEYRERAALPERFLLYVGRLAAEKNLMRLLHAYRRYRDVQPDGWKLVIVGDGPQRKELLKVARNLNLDDVVWAGFVQVDELPVYYALSDGFILPSVSEPWGLVVNEAMACGLPVLVSDRCGAALDLVAQGKNGYTFDPLSVDEMAEQMVRLAGLDETQRMAFGRASKEIIAAYTPRIWAENLADCIRQTVSRVRRRE
jgi:glycosyltransferase involved in cell wall biosynthesis